LCSIDAELIPLYPILSQSLSHDGTGGLLGTEAGGCQEAPDSGGGGRWIDWPPWWWWWWQLTILEEAKQREAMGTAIEHDDEVEDERIRG
jgi:hypothetical protein